MRQARFTNLMAMLQKRVVLRMLTNNPFDASYFDKNECKCVCVCPYTVMACNANVHRYSVDSLVFT